MALVDASMDGNGAVIVTSSGVAAPARGVAQPHFHPHESHDNPFREPQFKTPRCRPGVPQQFESIEGARAYCRRFSTWYNDVPHRDSLGLHTPSDVVGGHLGASSRATDSYYDLVTYAHR